MTDDAAGLAYAFSAEAFHHGVSLAPSEWKARKLWPRQRPHRRRLRGAGPAPEAAHGLPEANDEPTGRLRRRDTEPST